VGVREKLPEVWLVPADGRAPAKEITSGANAMMVRWDASTGAMLASGTWGEDRYSLRRVFPEGGAAATIEPPVIFGSLTAMAAFDVSLNGRLLVYSREDTKGNIWVFESKKGTF
jgi:hypothetical protein